MESRKLLFIGNSFSVDVAQNLHQLSLLGNDPIDVYVLYIGGCPIKKHWDNYNSKFKEYDIYKNGEVLIWKEEFEQGFIKENWDYISFQQVSYLSGDFDSFYPEFDLLRNEIRKRSNAKFLLHETWSYAKTHSHEKYGSNPLDQKAMSLDIKNTYQKVSKKCSYPYVPVGEAIDICRSKFGDIFNADGYHLNLEGKMIGSIVWFTFLSNKIIDAKNIKEKYNLDLDYIRFVDLYNSLKPFLQEMITK